MTSINEQQPEQNHADLQGEAALQKLAELVKNAPTCFFCTSLASGGAFSTRPMSVQKTDASGVLWFLSANDSLKDGEIRSDSQVQLLFQGSAHSDFLTLYGHATLSADKEKIRELWEPILKTWFTEGVDDPRISVIRFVPEKGYYWDTKHNRAVALAKMVVGAVIGKTLDDSIEGKLQV